MTNEPGDSDPHHVAPTGPPDPVREAALIICNGGHRPPADTPIPAQATALERRLKQDIFNSLGRIKPSITREADFEQDFMNGDLIGTLPPALQGVAIARIEGALAFYNRVGWNSAFLHTDIGTCITDTGHREELASRFHAGTLHDLAYVHPRHLNKLLGKSGAATTWETLKSLAVSLESGGPAG